MKFLIHNRQHGMTLVEVVVAAGLLVTVFFAIVTGFRLALVINTQVQAKTVAIALANERIEFIRSLDYDQIGTEGGIPQGPIPQLTTTTVNNREYEVRTLIYWVDDPADGLGADDVNNITTDYKEIKIEVTWRVRDAEQSLFKLARITPRGIETTEDGGSLMVTVYDADFQPLPGAEVRVLNTTATTSIDTIRISNDSGIALFSGAPPLSQYQVFVTRPGYSSDQTYMATTSNPNPSTQPVTVAAGETSSLSFQIDRVSTLEVQTVTEGDDGQFIYDTATILSEGEFDEVVLAGDELQLVNNGSSYVATGTVLLPPVVLTDISRWEVLTYGSVIPTGTTVRMQLFGGTATSSLTVIPNSVLPNNETGILGPNVDISELSTSDYPILQPLFRFETAVATSTPQVSDIQFRYVTNESSLGEVELRMRGTKVIGLGSGGESVLKFDDTITTNTAGALLLEDIEWDEYSIEALNGNVIRRSCPHVPIRVDPNTFNSLSLTIIPAPARSLRVGVIGGDGNPIYNASVTLTQSSPSFSEAVTTDVCGQAWFSAGVLAGADYELQVAAPGFETRVIDGIEITGQEVETVQLFPL